MVDFIRKRPQVFVSSTFIDLTHERQAAVEAILTAGHIPAGMELFTSGDESQMDVIKQWIQESDVYLLILGGRYGSVEPTTQKSYTQLEYEYAVNLNKPLFACVIKEDALKKRVRAIGPEMMETDYARELKVFRALVLSKMVRFWEDYKDIKITIGATLSTFARREDLVGWVRAGQEADMPALADEMARLSKENAELRQQLSTQKEESLAGLTFAQMKALLESKGILEKFYECRKLFAAKTEVEREDMALSTEETFECKVLGLLSLAPFMRYELSEAGRRFLNKMEAEKYAAQVKA